ncbi:MAG TPA: 23S rRNA (guanosine(2251)-2'-O)-methyltransferase RlmB [Acidimicrobiales bacterium]|nr:23S rRNA (guanosine(2251)-2'-O)-methyltransferase RlmB [Acidimicrobiales bacterium]
MRRAGPAAGPTRRAGSPATPARRRQPDTHRELGGDQVEGRRAVRELLVAGRRTVRDIWLSETVDEGPLVAEILDLAEEARVTVRRVSRARLDAEARTEAPQGVLAHARPLQPVDLEQLCRPARAGQAKPFLLALDGVSDPQNLGALLRTAEVAGVTGVVLPRHRAAHVTPAVAKAAAGAIEYLPIALVSGLPAALATMAGAGVWTVGLDPSAAAPLWSLTLGTEPVAVVLGAEGAGLSRLTAQRSDVRLAIPHVGQVDSLNVAAAGALAMFEVARRRLG